VPCAGLGHKLDSATNANPQMLISAPMESADSQLPIGAKISI